MAQHVVDFMFSLNIRSRSEASALAAWLHFSFPQRHSRLRSKAPPAYTGPTADPEATLELICQRGGVVGVYGQCGGQLQVKTHWVSFTLASVARLRATLCYIWEGLLPLILVIRR
jgi:hypothetical protein